MGFRLSHVDLILAYSKSHLGIWNGVLQNSLDFFLVYKSLQVSKWVSEWMSERASERASKQASKK